MIRLRAARPDIDSRGGVSNFSFAEASKPGSSSSQPTSERLSLVLSQRVKRSALESDDSPASSAELTIFGPVLPLLYTPSSCGLQ